MIPVQADSWGSGRSSVRDVFRSGAALLLKVS